MVQARVEPAWYRVRGSDAPTEPGRRLPPGSVRVAIDRPCINAPILRLSPIDLTVATADAGPLEPGRRVTLRLETGADTFGPLGALVRGRGAAEAALDLDPDPDIVRALNLHLRSLAAQGRLGLPPDRDRLVETIRDPDRIWAVVRSMAAPDAAPRLVSGRASVPLPPLVVDGADDFPLRWALARPWPEPPFEIHLLGLMSAYTWRVDEALERGGLLAVRLPLAVRRTRTRAHRRAAAPPGWIASFAHPLWPERRFRVELRNVALGGIRLEASGADEALLFGGLVIPDLWLEAPGLEPLCFSAVLAHESRDPTTGALGFGAELTPRDDVVRGRWLTQIAGVLYPNTHQGGGRGDAHWQLYDAAGYFRLSGKSAASFDRRRDDFIDFHDRLAQHPDVGAQIFLERPEGLECSITAVRAYASTWLAYQLARQRQLPGATGSGRNTLREIVLHGFEYAYRDPAFAWHLTWIQHDATFSKLLVHDLVRRFEDDTERVLIQPFRAFEGTCEGDAHPPSSVGLAEAADIHRLLEIVGGSRTRPYLEAHDLVPDRFDFATVSRVWQRAGLERERAVLVARRGGVATAAAVCELATEGAHLFGLLDVVRLFALEPGGEGDFADLLQGARVWFREHGKYRFAYFAESADLTHARGLVDLGGADLMVIAASVMPDQLEHAWEITFPREPLPGPAVAARRTA